MADPEAGYRAVGSAGKLGGGIMIRSLRSFGEWLTLKDYERDREVATRRVVARISRGSTNMQNGWYIDDAGLRRKSLLGDRSIEKLRRFMNAAQRQAPGNSPRDSD